VTFSAEKDLQLKKTSFYFGLSPIRRTGSTIGNKRMANWQVEEFLKKSQKSHNTYICTNRYVPSSTDMLDFCDQFGQLKWLCGAVIRK
jgi:hypothetical protein